MPVVKLRKDPQWSVRNRTFGRYIDDHNLLEVAWGQRHIMDVLRTVAHELTHRHQHEREDVPSDAGETGSRYENEANARAGILMRDYARLHPEYFAVGQAEELHGNEIDEDLKGSVVAALSACIIGGGSLGGCATQQGMRPTDAARIIYNAKQYNSGVIRADVAQELNNFIRAQRGETNSQNSSRLYQLQRQPQNESVNLAQTFGVAGHKVVWEGDYFYVYKDGKLIYRSPTPRQYTKEKMLKAAELAIDHINDTSMSYYKSAPGQGADAAYKKLQQVIRHRLDKGMNIDGPTINQEVAITARDFGISVKDLLKKWAKTNPNRYMNTPELYATYQKFNEYFQKRCGLDSAFNNMRMQGGYNAWISNQMDSYINKHGIKIKESASGYIPTKKQAKDPRWSMALTQDIRPGQLGKEANKLKLKTNSQGQPQIANPNGLFEKLALELNRFKRKGTLVENEQLDEVRMSPSALQRWAKSPAADGIRAGFEAETINDFKGLNKRSPWFALVMLMVMISMAGIPPSVGFFAKLSVLRAALAAGYTWLVVFSVMLSLVGAFYYLRIIKVMYMDEPEDTHPIEGEFDMRVLLSLNGIAIFALGILPQPLMSLLNHAVVQSLH
jgi:hypothetical protein